MRYNLCGIAKADIFQLIIDLCELLSTLICGKMVRSELPGLSSDTTRSHGGDLPIVVFDPNFARSLSRMG